MVAFRQTAIGFLMYGGCLTFFVCGLSTWFLAFAGAVGMTRVDGLLAFFVFCTIAGPIASISALVYGLASTRREHQGPRKAIQARVIARYALDRTNVMHTDEVAIQHCNRPRYFVRLYTGSPECDEYECSQPTFWQAGEGMWGDAEIQGKWLGSFRPHINTGQGRQDDTVPDVKTGTEEWG